MIPAGLAALPLAEEKKQPAHLFFFPHRFFSGNKANVSEADLKVKTNRIGA